ncbi:MAG: alpha-ribazole phosphatase family protein [Pseudomonadota bacterium]
MALILLRHTVPDVAPGICYGQTDLDVSETFMDDADAAFAALPDFNRIVTSPLRRCQKLALYIGERRNLSIEPDTRLTEMDFGTWENRAWADIPRAQIDDWADDFQHARPHAGESVALFQARVRAALEHWGAPDLTTLIVTHAGVIRAALAIGDTAADFNAQIDFGEFVTIS